MARGATKPSPQTTCGACGAGVPYGPGPTTANDGWPGQVSASGSDVMRQLALAAGVPDACILLEDQATSTFQSALRCTAILRQHGWSTALLVTDRYHLRRALFVFRSCGIQAYGIPHRAACIPVNVGSAGTTGGEKPAPWYGMGAWCSG